LRGLFFILTVLTLLGLEEKILIQGVVSHLVFLAAGIAYAVGTVLNWKEMQIRSNAFSCRPTQHVVERRDSAAPTGKHFSGFEFFLLPNRIHARPHAS